MAWAVSEGFFVSLFEKKTDINARLLSCQPCEQALSKFDSWYASLRTSKSRIDFAIGQTANCFDFKLTFNRHGERVARMIFRVIY